MAEAPRKIISDILPAAPVEEAPKRQHKWHRKLPQALPDFMSRRLRTVRPHKALLLAGLACLTVCLLLGTLWIRANAKPIPRKYRNGLTFPLYYPYHLPRGYSVDRSSFTRPQKAVLAFSINTPLKRNVAVTEERIPQGVTLTQSSPSGIDLPFLHNFTTGIGPAQVSLWGQNMVCSIVTTQTWIILNVTGLTTATSLSVAESFAPL
jgi:hypothetical protein